MADGHAHPDTYSDAITHAHLDAAADPHAVADLYAYTLCPADGDSDTHGHAHPGAHPHAAAHLDTDAAANIHLDSSADAYILSYISADVH